MDPVSEAIERAIQNWCGAAPGSYGPGTLLSDLWAQANGGAVPFDPNGIDSLVAALLAEEIFANCDQANGLGDFLRGGDRTVGDLYDFLSVCGEA